MKLYQDCGVELSERMKQQAESLILELEFMEILAELKNLNDNEFFCRSTWIPEEFFISKRMKYSAI